jgi:hypothetical protein
MAGRLPKPPGIVELECGHIPAVVEPATFASVVLARGLAP